MALSPSFERLQSIFFSVKMPQPSPESKGDERHQSTSLESLLYEIICADPERGRHIRRNCRAFLDLVNANETRSFLDAKLLGVLREPLQVRFSTFSWCSHVTLTTVSGYPTSTGGH